MGGFWIDKHTKYTPKKKREFGVILESIDSNVKHVVETVDDHTRQIKEMDQRLKKVEENLNEVKDDVAVIKVGVGATEGEKPLKQRIGDLEKRTDMLEVKAH